MWRYEPALFSMLALASLSTCRQERAPVVAPPSLAAVPTEPGGELRAHLEPEYLAPELWLLLADRMQQHGHEMTNLMWAMLFLESQAVTELSDAIANGPWLAAPNPDAPDQLNAALPGKFFELQSRFLDRARALSKASHAVPRDPAGIARAFGELSETCVACHDTYLYGDASVVPPPQ